MAKKTWTLTDVDRGVFIEEIAISPDDVDGAAAGYSVAKRTLRGGLQDGVDVIEVDNGAFRFTIVPTRGMDIWRASLGDLRFEWKSPVKGPVHPGFVRLNEASGLGWLDGFDELLVRCGLESNGAPEFNENGTVRHGLHGKIANLPAHKVEVTVDGDSGEISVTGVVNETRLFFNKLELTTTYTTRVGQPGVTVSDAITNISAETSELELLYHINFGVPLLNPGSKAVLPVAKMAPRDAEAVGNLTEWDTYGPETPGSAEAVFFFDLAADADGGTQTLLHNAAGTEGVSLKFNKNQLPLFHALEEPASGHRRLCNRAGAGHQLPQHQIVRESEGPGGYARSERIAPYRIHHRRPRRRGQRLGRRASCGQTARRRHPGNPRPAESGMVSRMKNGRHDVRVIPARGIGRRGTHSGYRSRQLDIGSMQPT